MKLYLPCFLFCTCLLLSAVRAYSAQPFRAGDEWKGSYYAVQGKTVMRFVVKSVKGSEVTALWEFDFQGMVGQFSMVGQYKAKDRSLVLKPLEWVRKPGDFGWSWDMLGLDGSVSRDGNTFSGVVTSDLEHSNGGKFFVSKFPVPFIEGDLWVGTYTAPQGETDINVLVQAVDGHDVTALFVFSHKSISASFIVRGVFDHATHEISLHPMSWVERPKEDGWMMVGLTGVVASDHSMYSGQLFISSRPEKFTFQLYKQPPPFREMDMWAGIYSAPQGESQLQLVIQSVDGLSVTAVWHFTSQESKSVQRGSFTLFGTYDPVTRRLTLDPKAWIVRPGRGWEMVGLSGTVSEDGHAYSGSVTEGEDAVGSFLARWQGSPFSAGETWGGRVMISRATVTMQVTLTALSSDTLRGHVYFFGDNGAEGTYAVQGSYDHRKKQVKLEPTKWTVHPLAETGSWPMVGLHGTISSQEHSLIWKGMTDENQVFTFERFSTEQLEVVHDEL